MSCGRGSTHAGPHGSDGVCTRRGKDVRRILATESGVEYSLAAVYDVLHRLGYSCLAPRPHHEHGDPVAIEDFKAQPPPWSDLYPHLLIHLTGKNLRL